MDSGFTFCPFVVPEDSFYCSYEILTRSKFVWLPYFYPFIQKSRRKSAATYVTGKVPGVLGKTALKVQAGLMPGVDPAHFNVYPHPRTWKRVKWFLLRRLDESRGRLFAADPFQKGSSPVASSFSLLEYPVPHAVRFQDLRREAAAWACVKPEMKILLFSLIPNVLWRPERKKRSSGFEEREMSVGRFLTGL